MYCLTFFFKMDVCGMNNERETVSSDSDTPIEKRYWVARQNQSNGTRHTGVVSRFRTQNKRDCTNQGTSQEGRPAAVRARSFHMRDEVDRVLSMRTWPKRSLFNVAGLAREGFFFKRSDKVRFGSCDLDKSDLLECFCCGVRIHSWDPHHDTPYGEHKRFSPNCPMVSHGPFLYKHNIPIECTRQRLAVLGTVYTSG